MLWNIFIYLFYSYFIISTTVGNYKSLPFLNRLIDRAKVGIVQFILNFSLVRHKITFSLAFSDFTITNKWLCPIFEAIIFFFYDCANKKAVANWLKLFEVGLSNRLSSTHRAKIFILAQIEFIYLFIIICLYWLQYFFPFHWTTQLNVVSTNPLLHLFTGKMWYQCNTFFSFFWGENPTGNPNNTIDNSNGKNINQTPVLFPLQPYCFYTSPYLFLCFQFFVLLFRKQEIVFFRKQNRRNHHFVILPE